mmetsp:Transcript_3532/g.9014  ORF Transcript_3532/g.9014 Transcript_3532/m.9014 type:complete len:210 (-) Transcript_3532:79-708(-)
MRIIIKKQRITFSITPMTASILLAFLLLLTRGIQAMRPAPFDPEYTASSTSGVRLVSTNDEQGGLSTTGSTVVIGADGGILYEMPVFTGRRDIYLSPSGSVIVLDGGVYFGSRLMSARGTEDGEEDHVVTSVYLNGELWRDITYKADLNGEPIPANQIRGGGWARRPFTLDVSWERDVLIYDMENASEKLEIAIPPTAEQSALSYEYPI